jgi:hypothetical protein
MWVQHSLHHDDVRFPVHLYMGLQVSFTGSAMLGLEDGEAEEATAHLLDLGQFVGGVGSEAGLEEEFGGEDGDHLLSAE